MWENIHPRKVQIWYTSSFKSTFFRWNSIPSDQSAFEEYEKRNQQNHQSLNILCACWNGWPKNKKSHSLTCSPSGKCNENFVSVFVTRQSKTFQNADQKSVVVARFSVVMTHFGVIGAAVSIGKSVIFVVEQKTFERRAQTVTEW